MLPATAQLPLAQLPLAQLAVFEAAARLVSFTAAGRELGVTQSAVSQQVRLLEERLGRRLFRRRAQGLELTDEGRALLPLVEDALGRLAGGLAELFGQPATRRREAPLAIRATIGFARYWLLPRLPRFLAAHPGVQLRLLSSLWPEPEPQPGLDLEIGYRRQAPEAGVRLTRDRLFPVTAPALAARLKHPADLAGRRLIHVVGFHEGWPQWLQAAGLAELPPEGPPALEVDTATAALVLAEAGEGLVLARSSYVADLLAAGRLAAPFALTIASAEDFWLTWPPGRPLSPAAQAFRDWIAAEAPQSSLSPGSG